MGGQGKKIASLRPIWRKKKRKKEKKVTRKYPVSLMRQAYLGTPFGLGL
jgi:hypothetical protein